VSWLLPQAKLQQRLHHASTTEQLLQGELTAIKEQLQQAQAAVQEVTAAAQASADAAKALHKVELDKLRQHLGSEGSAQVRQRTGDRPHTSDEGRYPGTTLLWAVCEHWQPLSLAYGYPDQSSEVRGIHCMS
jgi:hypothetical protein